MSKEIRSGKTAAGRGALVRLAGSRLLTGVIASALTILVVAGVAVATSSNRSTRAPKARSHVASAKPAPSQARRPASTKRATVVGSSTSVLTGGVAFVDPAETTGFAGITGQTGVGPNATEVAAFIPVTGTIKSFYARATGVTAGTVKFNIVVNGGLTTLSCTITAPSNSCSNLAVSVPVTAGNSVAVRILNSSGVGIRYVRWAAALIVPD